MTRPSLRRANLDIPGRVRFITTREDTATIYRASICDLSDKGAMITVDITCGDRLRLFEKIRYCILEVEGSNLFDGGMLSKAVYLQPQTSNGEFMTFKIGLAFERHDAETASQIRSYLAGL